MVHNVVNLTGVKLVEDRHGDSSVGQDAEEGCSPTAQVPAAEGNLVALLDARLFEEDMHLLDDARHVFVLQGEYSIIRHRIHEPMFLNTLTNHLVIGWYFRYFHLHISLNFVQRYGKIRYTANNLVTIFAQKKKNRAKVIRFPTYQEIKNVKAALL